MKEWLHALHLANFVDLFCQQNGIDGLTLLLMREDDLRQAPLSIERLADIKKLWYHIRVLQCQQNDFYTPLQSSKSSALREHEGQLPFFTPTKSRRFDDEAIECDHSSLSPSSLLQSDLSHSDTLSTIRNHESFVFRPPPGEKRKLLASFIYAFISCVWTSFIMVVVHNRVPNVQK